MTARERIDVLLGKCSFEELDVSVEHKAIDFGLADQVRDGIEKQVSALPGSVVLKHRISTGLRAYAIVDHLVQSTGLIGICLGE